MRLIFSRDRAAQLDLLLRSLDRYAPEDDTVVIYKATRPWFIDGYECAARSEHPSVDWWGEGRGEGFQALLERALDRPGLVTFFCDDDVLFRPIDRAPSAALCVRQVLTFSLRLSRPASARAVGLMPTWDWTNLDPHDHGYPGSIDGHTFRTADVLRMIAGQTIPDPLQLETVLARRAGAVERPLMACYPKQALVGVNVNSVASTGGNRRAGTQHPQPVEDLNQRFLDGERISLDALDFSGVDGCLVELPFVWERP